MRNRCGLTFVLLLALLAHAAAAYGASALASPGDPPAGSPAGAIYELPFEKGRADAAPNGNGGTSAGGGGTAGDAGTTDGASGGEEAGDATSFYRSENNFGSSSQVPGDPSAGRNKGEESASGAGAGSGTVGSVTDGTEAVAHVADTGNTSPAENIALLSVIGLIAVGVGVAASRANGLRSQ